MSIASEITRINSNIADAYTACNSKGATMPQTQNSDNLATTISGIQTGITPSGSKAITTNGTHDVTQYAEASVNVPVGVFPSGTKSITANGTYDVTDKASAEVNVAPNVGSKNISANGTYNASSDSLDGYSSVSVNIPQPSGSINITANGTYDVTDKSSAVVAIPEFSVTNVLSTAVDTDSSPYNNGLGYKEGYRLNTSGNEAAYSEYSVSGYIPVSANDNIRVINAGEVAGYSLLAFGYSSNFTVVGSSLINLNPVTAGHGAFMYGFKVVSGVSYVRIAFNKSMNGKVIVTKNQKISPLEE